MDTTELADKVRVVVFLCMSGTVADGAMLNVQGSEFSVYVVAATNRVAHTSGVATCYDAVCTYVTREVDQTKRRAHVSDFPHGYE